MTIKETYQNEDILPDFIPAGMPQYNHVELFFGYLTQYLIKESPKYNKGMAGMKKI